MGGLRDEKKTDSKFEVVGIICVKLKTSESKQRTRILGPN